MGRTHHFVPKVEHKGSHLESRRRSKVSHKSHGSHTNLSINITFPQVHKSNIYKSALNGFTTRQGTDRDTTGTHGSQNGQNQASAQLGANFGRRSMTEHRWRSAFYQGQTGPDKMPTPAGALSVKRHLKVAFSQTEARKARGAPQHP